jgi:subtilase family serine protease
MRIKVRQAGMAVAAAAMACLGLAVGLIAPPAALAAEGSRVALPSPVPYLAGHSPAAETQFATAVSTPGNPMYGRYLTPAQFRSRFGPAAAEAAATKAWARSAGLTVTGTTAHYVALTGTAPEVGSALDTSIHAYGYGSVTTGYAPVSGMSVPASLTRISTPVDRRNALGEFEVEAASVPPGDGGVGGEVGLAEDG